MTGRPDNVHHLAPVASVPEPFLTRDELARELRVHANTVARWAKQPGFPQEEWGPRTLRYQLGPVLQWLREHGRAAA